MTGSSLNRREVLGAAGLALGASVSGCNGVLSSGGDGGDGDDQPTYQNWYGPELAEVQTSGATSAGDVSLESAIATAPSDVLSSSVEGELRARWGQRWSQLELSTVTLDLDPENVDLAVSDELATFFVLTGQFDRDSIQATLDGVAEQRGTHQGRSVHVSSFSAPNGDERAWEGVGVGEETVVVSRLAADAESAAEDVRGILDTGAESADRYVDTNDAFSGVVDQIGSGVYVTCQRAGSEIPAGESIDVSGDTASIVTAQVPVGDASLSERVAAAQERIDATTPSEYDGKFRSVHAKWDEARSEDGLLIREGSLPVSDLSRINF